MKTPRLRQLLALAQIVAFVVSFFQPHVRVPHRHPAVGIEERVP